MACHALSTAAMIPFVDFAVAGVVVTLGCFLVWKRQATSVNFPPGPAPDFLIGHARILPASHAWEVYAKWKQTYGDVIYTYALGRSIVVLNSVAAARDLLDKKSLTFSDRPRFPVLNLCGWGRILPLLPYGDRFRKHRLLMHRHFSPQALSALQPSRERELRKLLVRLLQSPDKFLGHIQTFVSGFVVLSTYGHEVVRDDDAYVELVEHATHRTMQTGAFGTTIIDIFPPLRYIPAWLPGMGLKRFSLKTKEIVDSVLSIPVDELKAKRSAGSSPPCIMSMLLDEYEEKNEIDLDHEEDILNVGAVVYNAGSDTTKATLKSSFIAMVLNPGVVKRAQQEIDSVVGKDRLPTLDDRKHLPYVECFLKEIYRMFIPVPLGVPHQSTETEHYRGWTIPGGSVVVANIWQMMRDESLFPDPEVFKPERYLRERIPGSEKVAPGGRMYEMKTLSADDDPSSLLFGFGRRVCPGKYLADSTVWLTIASVLALFDIRPSTDPVTGITAPPKLEFEGEAIRYVKDFRCTIVPRNEKLAHTIQAELA